MKCTEEFARRFFGKDMIEKKTDISDPTLFSVGIVLAFVGIFVFLVSVGHDWYNQDRGNAMALVGFLMLVFGGIITVGGLKNGYHLIKDFPIVILNVYENGYQIKCPGKEGQAEVVFFPVEDCRAKLDLTMKKPLVVISKGAIDSLKLTMIIGRSTLPE